MKTYHTKRVQFLPITLTDAWTFFSTPKNLIKITPKEFGLEPLYTSGGDTMYPGQIIGYSVRALPLIKMRWLTEIKHVSEPHYFVDEQRLGPFALWHHQHHFKAAEGGVEMIDEVNYAIPLGIIGRFAAWLFVIRKVNGIFDYRFKVLEAYFNKSDQTVRKSA
jgi:ligand-binding SRPBCC domain-containing protein